MYILYLDESGEHGEATYFVLAGLAVFEREIYWMGQEMDQIQSRYFPDATEAIEFHAAKLRAPDESVEPPFDQVDQENRAKLIGEVYRKIREHRCVLFGVAIEKTWCRHEQPYERAFEELTRRFDLFLSRYNSRLGSGGEEQRGMIVVAESNYRDNLTVLGERFRGGSTRWGDIHCIADVPMFLPARNTRLLQMADFCANAVYRRYHSGNTRDFDVIAPRFDRDETDPTRVFGLVHLSSDTECACTSCISRGRSPRP